MRPRLAVPLLAFGALARATPAPVPGQRQLPPSVTIDTLNAVTVQNDRKVPVTGFLEYGTFDRRLGVVPSLGTRTLSLPGRIALIVPARGEMTATRDTMMDTLPPEELADATLTVDNPRGHPVTVYAEQGTFDVRLGRVPAHGRVTLRRPKSVLLPTNELVLFVHPQGGVDLASQRLRVRRGDHLGLRVPPS